MPAKLGTPNKLKVFWISPRKLFLFWGEPKHLELARDSKLRRDMIYQTWFWKVCELGDHEVELIPDFNDPCRPRRTKQSKGGSAFLKQLIVYIPAKPETPNKLKVFWLSHGILFCFGGAKAPPACSGFQASPKYDLSVVSGKPNDFKLAEDCKFGQDMSCQRRF